MEENKPRRMDYKSGAAGLGLGLALFALAPLDSYLDRRMKPLEEKIIAMKEANDIRLEYIQKTVDEIKDLVTDQGKEYNALNIRVLNLEFVSGVSKQK